MYFYAVDKWFYVGDLCNNTGLVLACLSSGVAIYIIKFMSLHHIMTQPPRIPILSPMHVGDPFKFEEILIYLYR